MSSITHKIGDSIKWKLKNVQEDGVTPVDWTGTTIECRAISKFNTTDILFDISTDSPTADTYISTDKLNIGEYEVIVKNTDNFKQGEYFVDFKYESNGFKTSSKSITLKILNNL